MSVALATCLCGKDVDGPVVSGPLVTAHVVCECGRECVVGRAGAGEIHKGNASFHGQKSYSINSGCHSSEVPLLKKIMGGAFESCIKDDGTVKFKNAQQQAAYVKHFEKARAVNAADPGCFARKGERPEV